MSPTDPGDRALAELAQDAVQQFRLQADERGVELKVQIPGGPGTVEGDIGLLARVLENLLDNGLRHTSNGGQVTVGLQETPQWVSIEVSDTGCGIAPDKLKQRWQMVLEYDGMPDTELEEIIWGSLGVPQNANSTKHPSTVLIWYFQKQEDAEEAMGRAKKLEGELSVSFAVSCAELQ